MPLVMSRALNQTAYSGRIAVQGAMDRYFDRPTPFAKRGVVYNKATEQNLTAAVVLSGDKASRGVLPATAFLGPQVHGGLRTLKAFEVQLRERGLLPPGHVAVPAKRAKLDRYGNMPQSFLNRVMADLQINYRGAGAERARTKRSLKRNKNYRAARFFVPAKGSHLKPGVYQRKPRSREVFPVILFLRSRPYTPRFPFFAIVEEHVDKTFPANFDAAFARAMRTAR
jgi:hypothetical protein